MLCKTCLIDKPKEDYEPFVYVKAMAFRGNPECSNCAAEYPTKKDKARAFGAALGRNTEALNVMLGKMGLSKKDVPVVSELHVIADKKAKKKTWRNTEKKGTDSEIYERLIAKPTGTELLVKQLLDDAKIPYAFQRQIGPYFPDFCFEKSKLILEVDGGYHNTDRQKAKDIKRDEQLRRRGWRVIRYTNHFIRDNEELFLKYLKDEFSRTTPAISALPESRVVVVRPRQIPKDSVSIG